MLCKFASVDGNHATKKPRYAMMSPLLRSMCSRLAVLIGAGLPLFSLEQSALADPAVMSAGPAGATVPPAALETRAPGEDTGTFANVAEASIPSAVDPMLLMIGEPARTLRSWAEAVNVIKARSIDLRIALLDVTRAEAQSRTALAALLPNINAGANYTHQFIQRTTRTENPIDGSIRESTTPSADTLSGSVSLSVPLINAPAWYALGTAKAGEDVAHLSVEDQKRKLTVGVANAILAVVTAERVAEINRIGLANAITRQRLAQAKLRNGAATALDVERTNQDVISSRAALLSGDESLRQAREALGLALGFAEPVGVRPELRLDGLLSDTRGTCKSLSSLRERADLAGLEKQRQLAERQIKSVELQFAPTLNLQSALASNTPRAAAAPPVTWNIQAVLNWSIWDGGARYGALRLARAGAEQADARREALERSLSIEVQRAQRGVTVATDAVTVSTQARDAATQIDQMTQKTFRAGMSTSLELVTAASALRQAEVNLAVREFELVRAQVAAALTLASCPW
ncbi:MAG TPA: TolC family protein [Polyangiaceae bacterium]|nr:TolC family protein [Polyangiaceae bacterium]